MKKQFVSALLLAACLLPISHAWAQGGVTVRPISDFLQAQGTFCAPPPDPVPPGTRVMNGCWEAIHAQYNDMPNFLAQAPYSGTPWALVDYAGLTVNYIKQHGGPRIPTTFSGEVIERTLADGRADVKVSLFTSNALTWSVDRCECEFGPGNVLMGSTPDQVIHGAQPVLGDAFFDIEFINSAPGAPLPDLFQLLLFGGPDWQFIAAGFRSKAIGPMHDVPGVQDITEGTLGMLTVTVAGVHNFNAFHGLPASLVNLKAIGGGSAALRNENQPRPNPAALPLRRYRFVIPA